MGDPSHTAAPAAFLLGAALKASYLQVFKANAILARHPCQTAAAHLPCTRPPDDWGLFRQNPPALASATDLAGPHAATQGLIYARLCLMGDPSQRAALPPSDSRTRAFGGLLATSFGGLPPFPGAHILYGRPSSPA
jgi:hypothetical protein